MVVSPGVHSKIDGYSYEQALSHYVQVYFPTVMYVD